MVPWHRLVHDALEHGARTCQARMDSIVRSFSSIALRGLDSILATRSSCGVMLTNGCDGTTSTNGKHMLALASMGIRHATEVVSCLAASPAEVKARLAGVPVYAVVNQKREFILVSGDDDSGRQMSLLFFNKQDAEGFQHTIRKENPKMGKSSQVLSTSLEAVYELALGKGTYGTKNASGLDVDVSFRFMPDSRQVAHALELYKKAGISKEGFVGVPLFQAEGLTVRGDASRYTPLFFSKDDLDVALQDSFSSVSNAAIIELRKKIDRVKHELGEHTPGESAGMQQAKDGSHDSVLRKRLEGYEKRLKEQEDEARKKNQPRVDVGSFEDVLVKMYEDSKGEWSDVIFVPSGSLSARA